ncbi:olfactory receptor 6B9-like [Loxodonta africana]|uniref:olfactory receptor 6B9-like n=1 Tax=Loxodonta africana TaxID=9785 RepID=UPI0030D2DA06
MLERNITLVSEFILVGFPTASWLQILLFFLFLVVYLLVIVENLTIMLTVWVTGSLHKPMYYFLSSMSFLEVWYVSVTVPKMLDGFLLQRQHISFTGCMTQLYFFISLACTECVLSAAMAYDCYVAICHPLQYPVIMTTGYCMQLVAFSYMSGFMVSVIKVYFISHITFCDSNVMNHFFFDISPILKLACKGMSTAELVNFVLAIVILMFPFIITVLSYVCIVSTILHIPSTQGKKKAFSTCASHLAVVIIYYTAMIFMYVWPRAIASYNSNKLISAVYTVLTPMLNPFISCVRNQEVKKAMRKTVGGGQCLLS